LRSRLSFACSPPVSLRGGRRSVNKTPGSIVDKSLN
jgi:hypothetical protein